MRGILAYSALLALNAPLVHMAPATRAASTEPGTSLIQLDNTTPGFSRASSRLSGSFCPRASNGLNAPVEVYTVPIEGTTTIIIIYYCPGLPLDANIIFDTMHVASGHLADQHNTHGDRDLLPADDPYTTPVVEGVNCTVEISSFRQPSTGIIPHHLTYQIGLNALRGLFRFLYMEHHDASAITQILDPGLTGTMENIGYITIRPYQ